MRGKEPPSAACAARYQVRAGASITHKSKDLATVMTERFGDPAGFVGGTAASVAAATAAE
jgi:hypothetical protein